MEGCGPGVGLWGEIGSSVLDMSPLRGLLDTQMEMLGDHRLCESGAQKRELGWRHKHRDGI